MPNSLALPKLCLASQSPRRRQLLETLGLTFECNAPGGPEEDATSANVEAITQRNALTKALEIQKKLSYEGVVIGADTLVILGQQVLGKPTDVNAARDMLRLLSGRTHRVVTGLTLVSKQFGIKQLADESRVTFKALTPKELSGYLDTKEPYDKAGAYAVQGLGSLFIEKIEGSYTNVMGLPIEKFLLALESLTGVAVFEWFK